MASKPKVTKQEVAFAYAVLRYLHANVENMYLLLAIVAWMRAESGQRYIGNNPLNLRPGADIAAQQIGVRKGRVGYFAVFKNLTQGAKAAAIRLLKAGNDYRGYGLIVKAAQRAAKGDKAQAEQALDFMYALAMSRWSSGHYGLGRNPKPLSQWTNDDKAYAYQKIRLISIWQGLLGAQFSLPATDPVQAEKRVPLPKQPRVFVPVVLEREWLEPYEAYNFYRARQWAPTTLPGDPR